jgi:hypothetical protein
VLGVAIAEHRELRGCNVGELGELDLVEPACPEFLQRRVDAARHNGFMVVGLPELSQGPDALDMRRR